jgi:hypothetical protein
MKFESFTLQIICLMKSLNIKLIFIIFVAIQSSISIYAASIKQSPPVMTAPGNALAFDGTDDYVSTSSSITNLNDADFTIEVWIKTSGNKMGVVTCQNGDGEWNPGEKCFYIDPSGYPCFVGWGNGYIRGNLAVNNNRWHHIAVVWDHSSGTSGVGKMYIDGIDNTGEVDYAANFSNVGEFYLGRPNYSEATNYFNGQIDEVRIWSSSRSQATIQANMYNVVNASSSNLAGYWNFDANTGTSLTDLTSNGNNGTLVNSPSWTESYAMVVPIPAAASEVYNHGFMANWTAPAFGTVTSYKLEVSSYPTFTSLVAGYNGVDCGTALSKKVSGLAAGHTYYYRVRADKSGNTGGVYYSPVSVTTTTDTRAYGDGKWTGYFFTQSDVGDLYPSFTDAQLKGTITENENFNTDWAGSGPTINGTTYNDFFHIRYKMSKDYPTGMYNITIGGDDGVRLSLDGGLTYILSDWSIHGYRTKVYSNLYLDGKTDFILDFYEHGGGAHVSFNIQKICSTPHIPKDLTITNTINATSVSWDANGNAASTSYNWIVFDQYNNGITSGTTTNTTLNFNHLDNTKSYRVAVYTGTDCNTPLVYSEFFTPKFISISSNLSGQTANSIQAAGTINYSGTEPITERGFCWSNATNATVNNQKLACGNGTGDFSGTITNLTANQICYFRAYATATGTVYGNEIAVVPAMQIKTGVVYNPQNSSATANVYITKPDAVTITEQGICWNASSNPTISDSHSTEFTLINLTNNTTYYVRGYVIYNGVVLYGNEQVYTHGGSTYRIKSASSGDDYGVLTHAGGYNGQPYYYDANGYALSYMGDHWGYGLDDYGEIWMEFDTSYNPGTPPTTGWGDLVFEALPNPEISYNKTTLNELTTNKGCFNSTIIITHNNANSDSFAGTDNEDFVANGKVVVHNLPAGLTATAIRQNALVVNLNITGTVAAHADVNDNMTGAIAVEFQNNAFTTTNNVVTIGNHNGLNIDFLEPVVITVTGTKNCSEVSMTAESNVILECNSTLNVGAQREMNQLTINPGAKLNLSNTVTVNDIVLKADDSNSFSAKLGSCMTVNGTLTFEKTMLDSKWYFLSFPCDVNVSDISMVGGGTLDTDFFILTYDGANRAINGAVNNWSHVTSGALTAKKGYAYGLKTGLGTKTLSFALNKTIAECETDATVPTTFYDGSLGANHKGWNLIGQPYISKFAGSNVGINYLTTWNGSTYVGKAKNLVSSINPFEAFFVQVGNTAPISFALSGRQAVRSVVQQDLQQSLQLNMTNVSGTDFSTLIFDNELSSDYEIGQDLEKWITTTIAKPQIYTVLNNVKYAYNALPIGNATNLPIGYFSKSGGASTISTSKVNVAGLSKLLLVDNKTGASTDLLSESYSFTADAGTNNSRFSIIPQRISTATEEQTAGKPVLSVVGSKVIISNLSTNAVIRIYDATGKQLLVTKANETNRFETELSVAGMYIVRIDVDLLKNYFKFAIK